MTPAKSENASTGPPNGEPAEVLWRFWEEGGRPELAAFLAPFGELTPARLAAVLRLDQRLRWEQGRRHPGRNVSARLPVLAIRRRVRPGTGVRRVLAARRTRRVAAPRRLPRAFSTLCGATGETIRLAPGP